MYKMFNKEHSVKILGQFVKECERATLGISWSAILGISEQHLPKAAQKIRERAKQDAKLAHVEKLSMELV